VLLNKKGNIVLGLIYTKNKEIKNLITYKK